MIVPVTKETEKIWAELCVALWPDDTIDSFIQYGRKTSYKNVYLYFLEEEAVACLWISLRYDYVEGTDSHEKSLPVGYLEGIYVKPEFRKQGIAQKLVEFAKEWAIEKGCLEFASDCDLDNDESRNFHNKIGFEEASKNVHFTMKLR